MDAGPAGAPAVPDPPDAQRKGHAVAKRELLEHWWDVNFDGGPAAVEVLVHRLRRKVGAAGHRDAPRR